MSTPGWRIIYFQFNQLWLIQLATLTLLVLLYKKALGHCKQSSCRGLIFLKYAQEACTASCSFKSFSSSFSNWVIKKTTFDDHVVDGGAYTRAILLIVTISRSIYFVRILFPTVMIALSQFSNTILPPPHPNALWEFGFMWRPKPDSSPAMAGMKYGCRL